MINLVHNWLEGKWAAPIHHPVTCANPAPWQIIEMKIECGADTNYPVKIWIRGEGSMWFRLDQCYFSEEQDLKAFLESKLDYETTKSLP